MRLLFLNYECPPIGGGAGFAMMALAQELAGRGHEVDVLTGGAGAALAPTCGDGVRILQVPSFRRSVHHSGMMGVLSYLCSAGIELPLLARRRRYDALHYYFGIPTGLLSRVPGPHRSLPYLLSLRGSDVPGYEPRLRHWHSLMWPLTRKVWRGAHRVIANSDGLRHIALTAEPAQPIEVIHNGVVPVPLPPLPVAAGVLRVLTVGRLIERKGIDTLIRAMALLRDEAVSAVIVGEGPSRSSLTKLARQLGVLDRVTFKGFVQQPQLAAEYRNSDVFVLASHSESCSMALLEGIGSGLPVVATGVGGTPELVRHERNGLLVSPGAEAQLADALRLLMKEPQRRAAYGAAGVALARDFHSWAAVARRYELMFEEAIASQPARARQSGR
jgi:glycosyltransferase involved in cell wall biosynthesis